MTHLADTKLPLPPYPPGYNPKRKLLVLEDSRWVDYKVVVQEGAFGYEKEKLRSITDGVQLNAFDAFFSTHFYIQKDKKKVVADFRRAMGSRLPLGFGKKAREIIDCYDTTALLNVKRFPFELSDSFWSGATILESLSQRRRTRLLQDVMWMTDFDKKKDYSFTFDNVVGWRGKALIVPRQVVENVNKLIEWEDAAAKATNLEFEQGVRFDDYLTRFLGLVPSQEINFREYVVPYLPNQPYYFVRKFLHLVFPDLSFYTFIEPQSRNRDNHIHLPHIMIPLVVSETLVNCWLLEAFSLLRRDTEVPAEVVTTVTDKVQSLFGNLVLSENALYDYLQDKKHVIKQETKKRVKVKEEVKDVKRGRYTMKDVKVKEEVTEEVNKDTKKKGKVKGDVKELKPAMITRSMNKIKEEVKEGAKVDVKKRAVKTIQVANPLEDPLRQQVRDEIGIVKVVGRFEKTDWIRIKKPTSFVHQEA